MKSKLLILLTVLFSYSTHAQDFYQMEFNARNATVTVTLNGMVLFEDSSNSSLSASIPVHLYLIGKNNKLTVVANREDADSQGEVHVNIAPFERGEITDTEGSKKGVAEIHLELTDDETVTAERIFDNEKFNFSSRFKDGGPITEKEALRYARDLYGYLETGDVNQFVEAMEPKVEDYSIAYNYPKESLRDDLSDQLADQFFQEEYPPLETVEITAKEFAEGRVWQLQIDGKEFLSRTDEMGTTQLAVYIARVDGNIQIIR